MTNTLTLPQAQSQLAGSTRSAACSSDGRIFNIKVKQCFRFKHADSKRYPDEYMMYAIVNLLDVPSDLPQLNVRSPKVTHPIYKDMRLCLANRTRDFLSDNRGIYLTCDGAFVNDENILCVDFGVKGKNGILDGGRTHRIIIEEQLSLQKGQIEKYALLVFHAGASETKKANMVASRNTALRVHDFSIADFRGNFDFLKEALANHPFDARIYYEEGSQKNGVISVLKAMKVLTVMNPLLFDDSGEGHCPNIAYGQMEKDFMKFVLDNMDKFKMMSPIIVDIFNFYDFAGEQACLAYLKKYRRKPYALPFVKGMKKAGKKTKRTLFSNEPCFYSVFDSALMPMMSSMRWMVRKTPQGLSWAGGFENMKKCYIKVAPLLMKHISDVLDSSVGMDLDRKAKRELLWSDLHRISKESAYKQKAIHYEREQAVKEDN